jgi:hypothetical protein
MNNIELEKRVKQFTSELAYKKGYVCSVDLLIKLGIISESDYQNWRFGKIEYLEKVCETNLHKLSTVNKLVRKYAVEFNLEKSWTGYNKWGMGPKTQLIFSKTRNTQIEYAYATHFLDKRRMAELESETQLKKSSATGTMTNNQNSDLLQD